MGTLYFKNDEKDNLMKLLEVAELKIDSTNVNEKIDLTNFVSGIVFYEHDHEHDQQSNARYFFNPEEIKRNPEKLKKHEEEYNTKVKFSSLLLYRRNQSNIEVDFQSNKIIEFGRSKDAFDYLSKNFYL